VSRLTPVVAIRVGAVWVLYGSEEFALPYVAPPGSLLLSALDEAAGRPSSLVQLGIAHQLALAPSSCTWAFDITSPLDAPHVEVLARRLCAQHPASPCTELHDTPHLVEGCSCACSGSLHSLFVSYGTIDSPRSLLEVLASAADSLTLRSLDTTDGLRAIVAVAAQGPERARVWAQLVLADTDPSDALLVAESVVDVKDTAAARDTTGEDVPDTPIRPPASSDLPDCLTG
jgi:hypothetical protein